MAEIIGKVIKAGKVRIDIKVEIFVEKSNSDLREKAVEATFTFAVINDNDKPIFVDWVKRIEQDLHACN
jgi:acyl-CoA hydrolase